MIRTPSVAWARAEVEGLQVTGDLFSRSHTFVHDERTVTVSVPEVRFGPDHEPVREHQDRAAFRQGFVDDKRLDRMAFEIAWLEVTVGVRERISLPDAMLETTAKRPELAGPQLTNRLDKLIIDYETRMAGALLHWEQTVRWLSGSSALGTHGVRVGRASAERLQLTAFQRASDGHRFWLPTGLITLHRRTTLDAFLWEEVGRVLTSGQSEPIWFRYLDEACHRDIGRDLGGAILSCAIACETLAREVFWFKSGATQDENARDLLDRLPVSGILRKWRTLTGLSNSASNVSGVERVFKLRNRLMHAGGKGTVLTEAEVSKLLIAARGFIRTGDEWYFSERQLPNPRCAVAQHRAADLQASAWLM